MIDQVGTITDRASWIVTRVTGLEEGCFMEVSYGHTMFRVSMINM